MLLESSRTGIINEPNYQWQMKFINQLLENFKEVYSFFRDNIWGIDLADMQSLSKYKKGVKYLLCTTDLFSKYAWVSPIKDKKRTSIVNAFKKIISEGSEAESKRQKNQIKYWLIKVVNFIIILLKIF